MPGRTLASLGIHAPPVGGGDFLSLPFRNGLHFRFSLCYKGASCAPQKLACERRIRGRNGGSTGCVRTKGARTLPLCALAWEL